MRTDIALGGLSLGLLVIGALCINVAEGHRTTASLTADREGRRRLGWYLTRRSYSLDEFDDVGRRAFRIGRLLIMASAVGLVGASLLRHR